jgi:hypothetical protein
MLLALGQPRQATQTGTRLGKLLRSQRLDIPTSIKFCPKAETVEPSQQRYALSLPHRGSIKQTLWHAAISWAIGEIQRTWCPSLHSISWAACSLASREFVFSSAPFEEIADAMLNSFFKAKDSIQGTQNKLFVRMSTLGTAAVLMDFSE